MHDLTAERAAYALDAMCVDVPPRGAREWNQECILAAMKWARQEALREAANMIKLMPMLTAHNVAAILDRLASEGVME